MPIIIILRISAILNPLIQLIYLKVNQLFVNVFINVRAFG